MRCFASGPVPGVRPFTKIVLSVLLDDLVVMPLPPVERLVSVLGYTTDNTGRTPAALSAPVALSKESAADRRQQPTRGLGVKE